MADLALYQRMAETALRLIEAKGQQLVLKRATGSSYDPRTDTDIPGEELTQPIQCVVLPASKGTLEAFDNRVESGTLIEQNLRALKIAAKGLLFEPKAGDYLDFEDSRWKVLGSTPLNPAGIPLVYNATVERA